MGVFDNIKNKAQDLVSNDPEKVEEISDKGLDFASEKADSLSGGRYTDQINSARDQADARIGVEGTTANADELIPDATDPAVVDAEAADPPQ
ncbi:MAG: antitoxin [Actinomycetia bacterium]|nr:antitoxin [Actinomycetes bacterium]